MQLGDIHIGLKWLIKTLPSLFWVLPGWQKLRGILKTWLDPEFYPQILGYLQHSWEKCHKLMSLMAKLLFSNCMCKLKKTFWRDDDKPERGQALFSSVNGNILFSFKEDTESYAVTFGIYMPLTNFSWKNPPWHNSNHIMPRHAADDAPDMPYMVPKWSICDLSVSYLISWKRLLFENTARDGSFQHCTWLYQA